MSETYDNLSRRERQVMDILLELGTATVKEVQGRLPDPPSYSTARSLLARLEDKGHARHTERDLRYVYQPVVTREQAGGRAVARLVRVFYGGSLARAVNGLVELSADGISDEEFEEIEAAINAAKARRKP